MREAERSGEESTPQQKLYNFRASWSPDKTGFPPLLSSSPHGCCCLSAKIRRGKKQQHISAAHIFFWWRKRGREVRVGVSARKDGAVNEERVMLEDAAFSFSAASRDGITAR